MEGLLFDIPLATAAPDLAALRRARVCVDEKVILPGRDPNLAAHLKRLAMEFAGDPQIDLYHAALQVLIRRGIQTEFAFSLFEALWREQGAHLLSSLSARWLISACDTIIDRSPDPCERAIACVGVTLMNTIKLYETERLTNGPQRMLLEDLAEPVPLFDGMTSFAVEGGDMIYNLRKRTQEICSGDSLASRIVLELLKRADRNDTIYRRLLAVHRAESTRW